MWHPVERTANNSLPCRHLYEPYSPLQRLEVIRTMIVFGFLGRVGPQPVLALRPELEELQVHVVAVVVDEHFVPGHRFPDRKCTKTQNNNLTLLVWTDSATYKTP